MISCCFTDVVFSLQPAVADESPTEVVEKPVPRPRSIFKLKSQCNDDNNTVYCADTSSDAASVEVSGDIKSW